MLNMKCDSFQGILWLSRNNTEDEEQHQNCKYWHTTLKQTYWSYKQHKRDT